MKHLAVLIMTSWVLAVPVNAQAPEKKPMRVSVGYFQQNEALPILKVSTKSKTGKKFEPIESIVVNLFYGDESAEGFMGRTKTNVRGEASLTLPKKFQERWTSASTSKFVATVTGYKDFDDASSEIEITRARMELVLNEADSVRTISAKLFAYQDRSWVAVPDAEVKLVVERILNDIAAGEEDTYTTNETGEVSSPFNLTIPGDRTGNLTIGAKIEDHELYGNIEATKTIAWGSRLAADNSFAKRTLWATRDKTPWWLLVFPNLIITGVWGIIYYLIYQLIQIRRLGKIKESA